MQVKKKQKEEKKAKEGENHGAVSEKNATNEDRRYCRAGFRSRRGEDVTESY